MTSPYQPDLLFKLAHQVLMATDFVDSGHASEEALLTSADLSRVFGMPHDKVKKYLVYLKNLGLLRPIGLNPKRYRFDRYQFKQLLNNLPDDADVSAFLQQLAAAS